MRWVDNTLFNPMPPHIFWSDGVCMDVYIYIYIQLFIHNTNNIHISIFVGRIHFSSGQSQFVLATYCLHDLFDLVDVSNL